MVDSMATSTSSSLVQRMIRAAKLEPHLYEEVEADQTATREAAIVVAIVAVAGGIGSALHASINQTGTNPLVALIFGVIWALVGWVIWSYLTYFVGTRLFSGRATPGELLRTIGFAQAPGVLNILSFIPVLGGLIGLAAGIWVLVAGVVAVRQALDFDTGKAILTTIIGWLVLIAIPVILGLLGLGVIGGFAAVTQPG
ncbi:MAG: Yip1 family protein [Chloroflexota bacterium]